MSVEAKDRPVTLDVTHASGWVVPVVRVKVGLTNRDGGPLDTSVNEVERPL